MAPLPIEDAVREELAFVSNCVVIGDGRRFLSVLLCLRSKPDSSGQPTDTPDRALQVALQRCGSGLVGSVREAAKDLKLRRIIEEGIEQVNRRAVSRAQQIRSFAVLEKDFSVESGVSR